MGGLEVIYPIPPYPIKPPRDSLLTIVDQERRRNEAVHDSPGRPLQGRLPRSVLSTT